MRRLHTALAAIALLAVPAAARAQDGPLWRTLDLSRQLRDSAPQRVHVEYGAGRVDVRGSSDPLLYALHVRYDESRAVPLHRYDAEQRTAVLGLESRGAGLRDAGRGDRAGELRLALTRTVPLDLEMDLGGTQATLELGGLMLQSARLECGATDATLSFSTANKSRLRDLEINVGAADFTALHLANANADQIRVRGGVGSVDLDFGGTWTRDLAVLTRLAVGTLTLHMPSDVGVRVEVQRVAAGFDHEGLVKRSDAWYSENWDRAPYKMRVNAETWFGRIDVQRNTR